MTQNELIWIKTGYEVFATSGSGNLRIESLAQKVGISKSSFYHYFADIEVFTQLLKLSFRTIKNRCREGTKRTKHISRTYRCIN